VARHPQHAGIAVFVNPRSRANRRNPRLASEMQAILGDAGRVLAPQSLEELETMTRALRATPPAVIAVHGGDGTLHRTLTALGRTWSDDPLPPLAVLCGGTMNVVATSLRIKDRPIAALKAITEAVRAGRPLETLRRRCLRIDGQKLGFVFGNGLMANFLGEYYAQGRYGARRALWLIVRTFFSALVNGPFARRVFRRFDGVVRVDGRALEQTRFVGVGAATVREVGLGFKLNHRADDDLERFGVLAIHAPPLALVGDLRAVHDGRGISSSHAFSDVASTLEVEPARGPAKSKSKSESESESDSESKGDGRGNQPGEMSYTIDGDLYKVRGILRISIGPPIDFVRPPHPETRSTRLIAPRAGDTMELAR
jgi:diacylglycerol kinase family enzyme